MESPKSPVGTSNKCEVCGKSVFPMEQVSAENKMFHKVRVAIASIKSMLCLHMIMYRHASDARHAIKYFPSVVMLVSS